MEKVHYWEYACTGRLSGVYLRFHETVEYGYFNGILYVSIHQIDHVSHYKTMYMYEWEMYSSAEQVTGNTFLSINHCNDVYDCTSPSTTMSIR